jgi:hypothetical protein
MHLDGEPWLSKKKNTGKARGTEIAVKRAALLIWQPQRRHGRDEGK